MKIVITNVGWEDTGKMLRDIATPLEQSLNLFFDGQSHGYPLVFILVIVAFYSDSNENEKHADGYNKSGTRKDPVTNERLRHVSIGIPVDREALLAQGKEANRIAICDALLARLAQPIARMPKDFDYAKFVSDLQIRLEILKKADYA